MLIARIIPVIVSIKVVNGFLLFWDLLFNVEHYLERLYLYIWLLIHMEIKDYILCLVFPFAFPVLELLHRGFIHGEKLFMT